MIDSVIYCFKWTLYYLHEYRFTIMLVMFFSFFTFYVFFIKKLEIFIKGKNKKLKELEKTNKEYQESLEYYESITQKYKDKIKAYEQDIQTLVQEKPKPNLQANYEKGKIYEYKIKLYYESLGYRVFPNGYINGKRDGGVDLIAYKGSEVRLIQTKCYKNPPRQHLLRLFVGDCTLHIKKNMKFLKNKDIYKDFITSCEEIDYGVSEFLKENPEEINYQIKRFANE